MKQGLYKNKHSNKEIKILDIVTVNRFGNTYEVIRTSDGDYSKSLFEKYFVPISYNSFDLNTIDLQKEYNRFNMLYFDNMKGVDIKWGRRKSSVGVCITKFQRIAGSFIIPRKVSITISTLYKFDTYTQFASVLLHEMVHAYLVVEKHAFSEAHGYLFREKAKEVSAASGYPIEIYNNIFDYDISESGQKGVFIPTRKSFYAIIIKKDNKYYGRAIKSKVLNMKIKKTLTENFGHRLGADEMFFVKTDDKTLNTLSFIGKPNARNVKLYKLPNELATSILNHSKRL